MCSVVEEPGSARLPPSEEATCAPLSRSHTCRIHRWCAPYTCAAAISEPATVVSQGMLWPRALPTAGVVADAALGEPREPGRTALSHRAHNPPPTLREVRERRQRGAMREKREALTGELRERIVVGQGFI